MKVELFWKMWLKLLGGNLFWYFFCCLVSTYWVFLLSPGTIIFYHKCILRWGTQYGQIFDLIWIGLKLFLVVRILSVVSKKMSQCTFMSTVKIAFYLLFICLVWHFRSGNECFPIKTLLLGLCRNLYGLIEKPVAS